jgi:hypothetical protein
MKFEGLTMKKKYLIKYKFNKKNKSNNNPAKKLQNKKYSLAGHLLFNVFTLLLCISPIKSNNILNLINNNIILSKEELNLGKF